MKTLLEYLQFPKKKYDLFIEKLGTISFDLDNESLELLSESFKEKINEGYCITISDLITEMSQGAQRFQKGNKQYKNGKSHGNRPIWTSKDGDKLKIGDHATQREDRPIEKGGDGEHIDEQEIIDMFIYTWSDIMDMYYEGYLKHSNELKSFVTWCKCYLEGSENNLHAAGSRPENKYLWAAWMIQENYNTGKIDVTIRTIFRGEFFKHGKAQERIIIANNGYIKQKLPR